MAAKLMASCSIAGRTTRLPKRCSTATRLPSAVCCASGGFELALDAQPNCGGADAREYALARLPERVENYQQDVVWMETEIGMPGFTGGFGGLTQWLVRPQYSVSAALPVAGQAEFTSGAWTQTANPLTSGMPNPGVCATVALTRWLKIGLAPDGDVASMPLVGVSRPSAGFPNVRNAATWFRVRACRRLLSSLGYSLAIGDSVAWSPAAWEVTLPFPNPPPCGPTNGVTYTDMVRAGVSETPGFGGLMEWPIWIGDLRSARAIRVTIEQAWPSTGPGDFVPFIAAAFRVSADIRTATPGINEVVSSNPARFNSPRCTLLTTTYAHELAIPVGEASRWGAAAVVIRGPQFAYTGTCTATLRGIEVLT